MSAKPQDKGATAVRCDDWLGELEAALGTLRKAAKTLKKQKRMDIWGYVDDAGDFVEEALRVERSRSPGSDYATGG